MGPRAGKYKLGARAVKYKSGARTGKYKLEVRAGGRGPEPGSGAKQRAGGREIQIPFPKLLLLLRSEAATRGAQ